MDYFSRYVIIRPLSTQTAPEIARVLIEHVILSRAPPARLLSDRGAAFLSHLMEEVYRRFQILKINTSAYHPQTDGMVERFNHTVVAMLSHYVGEEQDDWDEYLGAVQFSYNTAAHPSTGFSPHEVAHGWAARTLALAPLGSGEPAVGPFEWCRRVGMHTKDMHKLVARLDAQGKEKAAERHAQSSNELRFVQGQLVWRRREARDNKLQAKLEGPFRVKKVYDNDTYDIVRVADGPKAEVERVHVQRLHPNRVPYDAQQPDQHEDEDASDVDEPEYRPPKEPRGSGPSLSATSARDEESPRPATRAALQPEAAPLRAASKSSRHSPSQRDKSAEQLQEENERRMNQDLLKALDDFVQAHITADTNAPFSASLRKVFYQILELRYRGNELDNMKARFRLPTMGQLIAEIKKLQQELRDILASSSAST